MGKGRFGGLRLLGLLGLATAGLAGSLEIRIQDAAGRPVKDAVVTAAPADGHRVPMPAHPSQQVDQVNQEFVPFVKVIPVGTEIFFPNKDDIRHQVYSFSPAKRFELPLYSGRKAPPVRFDKPGVVVLGCNIHDWMLAFLYVTEAPFFGQTGREGTTVLRDLPAGEYLVKVWHPRLKGTEADTARRLSVPASGATKDAWTLALKPEAWPRRHPGMGAGDYR